MAWPKLHTQVPDNLALSQRSQVQIFAKTAETPRSHAIFEIVCAQPLAVATQPASPLDHRPPIADTYLGRF